MKHDQETRDRVVALRASGMTYEAIVLAVGVPRTTVFRWCNAEYEAFQRQMSRAAKQRRKTPCPSCGQLVDYMRPGEFCAHCVDEARYGQRRRRAIALSIDGWSASEIAMELGMTYEGVVSMLSYWRTKGIDLPLRRARNRTSWERIREMYLEGAPYEKIGAELGISRDNVSNQITTMRRRGFDLPYRRAPRSVA
jgi:transposase